MAENGQYVDGSLYFYAPNKGAAITWTVLMAGTFALHAYQCVKYKAWKLASLLPFAALIFVAGYAARSYGAWHYSNLNAYIVSVVLIYAAPPMYELANYFVLGRILYYVPYHSPIHPGRVLTTFSGISAVIEALNGNGASRIANSGASQSFRDTGKVLLEVALILQLVVQLSFVALAVYFHRSCRKAQIMPANLLAVLTTLYISSSLIMVRTIYRVVEFYGVEAVNYNDSTDSISPIIRYEWFFWIFEGVTMLVNTYLLNLRHPSKYLPKNTKIYVAEDGVTEIEGPGYEDKRNFFVTLFDPFDIAGLIKGKDKKERYWETHERVPAVPPGSQSIECSEQTRSPGTDLV